MEELIAHGLPFWYWFVLGLLLLIAEVLAPGIFMMWLGFAAFATGLVVWPFVRLGVAGQGIVFALLSVASVGLWLRFRPGMREQKEEPSLNRRGNTQIGRVFKLSEAIVDGYGRAHVEDSVWRVSGPDLPAGSHVRVLSVDGSTLRVEPVEHG